MLERGVEAREKFGSGRQIIMHAKTGDGEFSNGLLVLKEYDSAISL
jgi:hypothetical protein